MREAMAKGEFDNLPGKGIALNLDDYFSAPEDVRIANSILKNAGIVPHEVELLGEIQSLRDRLGSLDDPAEKAKISREINEKLLRFNLLKEQRRG
ncbi:MAG TPA: DUF1992 domain-containing protein [Blastocatellia bacterium]